MFGMLSGPQLRLLARDFIIAVSDFLDTRCQFCMRETVWAGCWMLNRCVALGAMMNELMLFVTMSVNAGSPMFAFILCVCSKCLPRACTILSFCECSVLLCLMALMWSECRFPHSVRIVLNVSLLTFTLFRVCVHDFARRLFISSLIIFERSRICVRVNAPCGVLDRAAALRRSIFLCRIINRMFCGSAIVFDLLYDMNGIVRSIVVVIALQMLPRSVSISAVLRLYVAGMLISAIRLLSWVLNESQSAAL